MDQSQLIMTIVGLVANMATTLVLIKNGQVVILENKHRWIIEDFSWGQSCFPFLALKLGELILLVELEKFFIDSEVLYLWIVFFTLGK